MIDLSIYEFYEKKVRITDVSNYFIRLIQVKFIILFNIQMWSKIFLLLVVNSWKNYSVSRKHINQPNKGSLVIRGLILKIFRNDRISREMSGCFISPSVQHISSTQKGHSFSAPKIPQFHSKTPQFNTPPPPSVPYQKLLSSTPKKL